MKRISLRQMAMIVDVNYTTLAFWQNAGVLVPREVDPTGANPDKPTAYYHLQDLFAVAVVADLQQEGLRGKTLHEVIRLLSSSNIKARLAAGQKFLVIAKGQPVFHALPTAEFQTDGPGPVCFIVVDLEQSQANFRARMEGYNLDRRRKQTAKG